MTFVAVSAGIGAASLGIGVAKGISASHQANEIAKNNPRPTYQIPDEYKQNLAMAKQMAQIGIPQQAYNNQVNAINQSQAGAVGALAQSANPGGGLAGIVRAGNNANDQLNARDANARIAGEKGVLAANNAIANQKLQAQQYNSFDKYSEDFNRSQALKSASNTDWQNAFNGASSLASGLAKNYQNGGGIGATGTSNTSLAPGTASAMQIPQQYWNSPGLGPDTQQGQSGGFNSFFGQ